MYFALWVNSLTRFLSVCRKSTRVLESGHGKAVVMTVFAEMTDEILQLVLDNVSIVKSNSEIEDLKVCKKLLIKKLKCVVKQSVSILT